MKKSLLFGFAAALTLASCTTNDEILDAAAQTPMEFSSFVNKGTKAPVNDLNFDTSTFGVWGYKGKGETAATTPVFATQGTVNGSVGTAGTDDHEQTVSYTEATSSWAYENLRYWDKTCNYMFLAYAPVNTTEGAVTIDDEKIITISNFTVNSKIDDQIDLMVAQPLAFAKGSTGNSTEGNKIKFNFYHTLTKVNIQFNKSVNLRSAKVILRTAELKGIQSTGTYTTTTPTTTTKGTYKNKGEWNSWSGSISFLSKENLPSNTPKTQEGEETSTTPAKNELQMTSYLNMFQNMLMIPQTFSPGNFILNLNYTINGEEFTRTIDMGNTEWTQNMSILYTLTIDADAIIFDSPVVEKWDDVINAEGDINEDPSHVDVPKN